MKAEFIEQIGRVEEIWGIKPEQKHVLFPYKHFDRVWIKADKPLAEIYNKTIRYSELRFYPNTNYKAWVVWILMNFKLKKGSRKLSYLLGFGYKWPFVKPVYLPLEADIIYYRYHTIIMVYTASNRKKVIKVALTPWGKTMMKSEAQSQRLANLIPSKDVVVPAILNEVHREDLNFSVEVYFEGRRNSLKDKRLLKSSYYKVFQFMLELYLSNPIELQNLSENKFLGHGFVEEFLSDQDQTKVVMTTFKKLFAIEKKMILCRIHGDLSNNNILVSGDKVCIIDWGKSKHHYLAHDLDNSSYNTQEVYAEFNRRAQMDDDAIYPYHEQLFLGRFIELNRLIHNGIKRKTMTPYFYSSIKQQTEVLRKMAEKL